jgi:hypothetical protein|nr:MAG: hypothetical protein EDM05_04665 [Leptolyngbya sp. IPPAS B-1204]
MMKTAPEGFCQALLYFQILQPNCSQSSAEQQEQIGLNCNPELLLATAASELVEIFAKSLSN